MAKSKPKVTRGGINEIPIITPTRVLDSWVVRARAPAKPEARARMKPPCPTLVRVIMAGTVGSTSINMPIITEMRKEITIPTALVFRAMKTNLLSPMVSPKDRPIPGPIRGAMIMAAMITATLLLITPTVAIKLESTTIKR